jgi:Cd2+/Zn2+-exporting ATPase
MLTGDSNKIASKVANALNINKFYSELLPQDKLQKVEKYYNEHKNDIVACVGDGINDSPILARVDVGIAFGNIGSDIAIETSDVVIASDSISKVSMLIKIAKCTKAIVVQNIVLAIGIKVLFLLLGMFGFINLWLAVFGDVGVMILAVLNAIRVNYKKIK